MYAISTDRYLRSRHSSRPNRPGGAVPGKGPSQARYTSMQPNGASGIFDLPVRPSIGRSEMSLIPREPVGAMQVIRPAPKTAMKFDN